MLDYQVQPSTRRCCVSGRELQPGEKCFSVLLDEAGKLVRKDYAPDCWQGPPPEAFSFWVGRVPTPQGRRRPPIDDELLLSCFERLDGEQEPGRVGFRYVLALLLLRRRRLRLEEICQESGQEILEMRCNRTGGSHRVVNPGLTEEEMEVVQEDVFRVLGWE